MGSERSASDVSSGDCPDADRVVQWAHGRGGRAMTEWRFDLGAAPGPGSVARGTIAWGDPRSEEHTSELQSRENLVCRLLLEKKKKKNHVLYYQKKKKKKKDKFTLTTIQ